MIAKSAVLVLGILMSMPPSNFSVIYEKPITGFTQVVADASGAAYFFDRYGDVIRASPPSKPGGRWLANTLYTFRDGVPSGAGKLIFDGGNALYGPTEFGGAAGCGDVFQIAPPAKRAEHWLYSEVYAFPCLGGNSSINQALVHDSKGNIFGSGGYFDSNSHADHEFFFELLPPSKPGAPWSEITLYDGVGEILRAIDIDGSDNLYFADVAGVSDPDQVSKLTPPPNGQGPWTKTVIYSSSAYQPVSTPIVRPDGTVAALSMNHKCGYAFALAPQPGGSYTYETIHSFSCSGPDGAKPNSLVSDANGVLYGTTDGGGSRNGGVLFSLSEVQPGTWTETPLHLFERGRLGSHPTGVSFGPGGRLYGQTLFGGEHPPLGGTIFVLQH